MATQAPVVTVCFGVVAWAPPGTKMAVVGNHPALGGWAPGTGVAMNCSLGTDRFESEPDYFSCQARLPEDCLAGLEFKFVQQKPGDSDCFWESGDNRKVPTGCAASPGASRILPVERFKDGAASEADHTGRFYSRVKEAQAISARKVCSSIILGSCPRVEKHIAYMRSELGVTAVVNLQSGPDASRNCVAGIGMEEDPHAIAALYHAAGMEYVWLPTEDMCTAARTSVLPHAAFVLAGLLRNGHTIYVHCNAGVGRSVAAVCGFLQYCVGLSSEQVQHVVARARTVAYFDLPALEAAKPRYEALFGPPAGEWDGLRRTLLRDAGLPADE